MNVNYFKTLWKSSLMILMLCFGLTSVWGQTTVIDDTATGTSIPIGWQGINNITSQAIQQGGYYLVQSSGSNYDYLLSNTYDNLNNSNVTIEFEIATYGSGTNSPLKVDLSTDGGTTWTGGTQTSPNTPTSSTYISSSVTFNEVSSSNVRFRFYDGISGDKAVRLRNIVIKRTVTTPSYTLTYTAGANGTIDGVSPQTVQEGQSGTAVTAVPEEGYHFVNWSDDSTQNPRIDTNVTTNISVTANFAINTYTVTYDGNGADEGSAPNDENSPYNHGSLVTVLDEGNLVKEGHTFIGWATDAENPETIIAPGSTFIITSDVTLYAYWEDASKLAQTITFDAVEAKTYGDADFELSATSDSGLPISYTSTNTNVATIEGNMVTIVGAGSTDITAFQGGDDDYLPATPVVQTLIVNPKNLTISGVTVADKTYDGTPTASFATTGSLVGVVGEDDVTLLAGVIEFVSANAGNDIEVTLTTPFSLTGTDASNYTLTQPTLTGNILKADQTLLDFEDITKHVNEVPFALPATTAQGLPLTYESSNTAVATVSGNTIFIVGLGTTTITATQAGDTNWNEFSQNITLTVTEAPVIPKVIISQVYEGASNNKWIELANVGDTTIDLSQVKIAIWSKGGDSGLGEISGDPSNSTILSGTLSSGATFLIRHGSASTDIPHNPMPGADLSGIAQANFNGNDAIALLDLEDNILDAFGHGINNKDKSYHRKSEVSSPNATFTLSEWEERTLADIAAATPSMSEYIGTHIYGGLTVWTINNEWLDGIVPTITDDAIIEGDLTLTGDLSAKTLTVAAGGKITVPANTSLTVEGKITNNGEFTVESDGILYQNNYTGTNEGNITVKRAANPMKRLDYTLWSSPVSGMLLNQFSNVSPNGGTGTIWNRVYELGADAWESIWESYDEASTSTDTFVEAKGYLYRAFNSYDPVETTIFTGEFTGVPNNGEYSIDTPNTFDAIGNPYPSPISADDFILSNDVDAIYFWTNVNSSNGTEYTNNNWASYTTLGGVGVTIGDSGIIDPNSIPADNMHIQPGQGFVVYTEENSVSFNNAMRINSNGQFFRQMSNEKHRFWLNLSNEEVVFNQILVGYMDNATQGVDTGIDGKMFAYEGNALYSIIDNNEDMFVIQGRALPFTASDVVALGFRAVNAGSFTISLANLDGLFAEGNTTIYLKDNFTQTQHNLNSGAYSFVSEEGIFDTRFEVVYQTTMSVENPVANNANWVVYSQENGFQVQTQGFELKTVQVYDLLGRTIYTASAEGTAHHIPSLGADSVYIVKVTTTDNVVLSKKVK